jgi:hypothetical protein
MDDTKKTGNCQYGSGSLAAGYNRRMHSWLVSVAAAIATIGMAAHAHHSIAAIYDSSRQVTIAGTVAKFQLVNPHPFLLIDVTDSAGHEQQWKLEMDNRHELAAIGVTSNTFRSGDRVVVTGSLARSHPHSLYLLRLERASDGFLYEQIGPTPRIGKIDGR